jgi:transcription-repair coupling factor (superfamily II helicase)
MCRQAGVEKLDAGPKGMVLSFRANKFRNPAGLISWLGTKGGVVKLRPDHKLAIVRDMSVGERVKLARDVVVNLNRIALQAKAA